MLVGAVLLAVLLAGAWMVIGTGLRSFNYGSGTSHALQQAMVLLERIEHDLDVAVIPPAGVALPLTVSTDGRELAFWVPVERGLWSRDLAAPIEAGPVRYRLLPIPGRPTFWPTRNGRAFRGLELRGWSFRHRPTSPGSDLQVLEIELVCEGVFGYREFRLARKKELVPATLAALFASSYPLQAELIRLRREEGSPADARLP